MKNLFRKLKIKFRRMRELILQTLRAWEEKLLNDECTPEEIRRLGEIVKNNVDVLVTTKDIAKIYDKPEQNVKMAISRNNIQSANPPKVRKFYSLNKIRNILPASWRHTKADVTASTDGLTAATDGNAASETSQA